MESTKGKSWSLVLLSDDKYAVASDIWFNKERTKCQWPPERSFALYRITKLCTAPKDSWNTYDVKKICVSGLTDFAEAGKLLEKYESSSDESHATKKKSDRVISMPCLGNLDNSSAIGSVPATPGLAPVSETPNTVTISEMPKTVTVPETPETVTVLVTPKTSNPLPHAENSNLSPASLMDKTLNITSPGQTTTPLARGAPISKKSLRDALDNIMAVQQNILQGISSKSKEKKRKKRSALSYCPLRTETACDEFAKRLLDDSFRRKLRQELIDIGGRDPRSTAQAMLRKLMDDSVVKLFAWKGQKPSCKKAFKNSAFATAILTALRKLFPKPKYCITELDLKDYLQDWLIQAPYRISRREKRQSSTLNGGVATAESELESSNMDVGSTSAGSTSTCNESTASEDVPCSESEVSENSYSDTD